VVEGSREANSCVAFYQYISLISPHTNRFFNQGSFICESHATASDYQVLHLLKDGKVSKSRWQRNSVTLAHAVKLSLKYHRIIYQTTYSFRVLNKCLYVINKDIKIAEYSYSL